MKKHKLGTWKDMGKKMKLSAGDKVVEQQEERSLFTRMMVVCKSSAEINLKEAIGQYEFSAVPRSLFSTDGAMDDCSMKSSLMTILVLQKYSNIDEVRFIFDRYMMCHHH